MSQPAATATVSVRVVAPRAIVFDLFTREIDRWWRRGPRFRHAGEHDGTLTIEPLGGGRVFERWREDGRLREFQLGTVLVWQPPERLMFTWRNATFTPLEQTEVEVTFAEVGSGTLVTVRHRGWDALRDDHPARHGLTGAAFARTLGLWWGDQLTALRQLTRPGPG